MESARNSRHWKFNITERGKLRNLIRDAILSECSEIQSWYANDRF